MWEERRRVRTSDRGGPVDLTLLSGRQTCRTTAVPEQAMQEGSEEAERGLRKPGSASPLGVRAKGHRQGG